MPTRPARRPGALRRFARGFGTLFRGFGLWRHRPGVMLLGLLPALIVFAVLLAALIALALAAPAIAQAITPFADGWDRQWRELIRALVGLALVLGAGWLAVATFTGITLAVGDPFYERVWRAAEQQLGGSAPDRGLGFWSALGDALVLIAAGLGVAVLAALLGLVPLVGTVAGTVVGVVLSGRLLAAELVSRPLEARGIRGPARRALLRGRGAEQLGFGVATQLCFLVPLGAVLVMPAAVAGATLLAREALDAEQAAPRA